MDVNTNKGFYKKLGSVNSVLIYLVASSHTSKQINNISGRTFLWLVWVHAVAFNSVQSQRIKATGKEEAFNVPQVLPTYYVEQGQLLKIIFINTP